MKLKMIVLREIEPEKKDFVLVGAKYKGKEAAKQKLSIELRETSADDRRKLKSEKGVVATALQMPMNLIKSFAAGTAAEAKAPKLSWGISAVNATKSKLTGAGVTVAVLDTGIDPDHPAFKGVELVIKNFTSELGNDLDGHGTHCAGTIFGRDVKGTRIGVAEAFRKR